DSDDESEETSKPTPAPIASMPYSAPPTTAAVPTTSQHFARVPAPNAQPAMPEPKMSLAQATTMPSYQYAQQYQPSSYPQMAVSLARPNALSMPQSSIYTSPSQPIYHQRSPMDTLVARHNQLQLQSQASIDELEAENQRM